MAQNRARGAAAAPDADPVQRLAGMLGDFMLQNQNQHTFKSPKFDGKTDVETFIRHFRDVQQANNWNEMASLLNLRQSLENRAVDCGDAETVDGVINNLRMRFGMTARQARDRLKAIRKEPRVSFQEYGAQIERLVNIAYATMPAINRLDIGLDNFSRGLENKPLQQHMLAVVPQTMDHAVRIAEEFTLVGSNPAPRHRMNLADAGSSEDSEVLELLKSLREAVKVNTENIKQLTAQRANPASAERKEKKKKLECFECGEEHLKRNCPRLRSTNQQVREIILDVDTESENDMGPQEDFE